MSKWRRAGRWMCVLAGTIVLLSWLCPGAIAAYQFPPPTSTNTPIPTDTQRPTNTPEPTDTDTPEPTPTDTPEPTPTNTDTPPQPTPTNTRAATAMPTATSQPTPRQTEEPPSQPNPNCQSSVQGAVVDRGGQPVTGATVSIRGDGWSRSILSDDQGRYGFAGLCDGTATLQATLPDGRLTELVSVSLSGQNQLNVTLSPESGQAAPTATAPASAQTAGAQTETDNGQAPEPEMPTTGSARGVLVGGAALGLMLLLSASVGRALFVRDRVENRK